MVFGFAPRSETSSQSIGRVVLQASAAFKVNIVFAATGYVILLGLTAFFLLSLIEVGVLRTRGVSPMKRMS
jgi:ABC-type nitrate/sulfonate/bicarbonate transport system permease component